MDNISGASSVEIASNLLHSTSTSYSMPPPRSEAAGDHNENKIMIHEAENPLMHFLKNGIPVSTDNMDLPSTSAFGPTDMYRTSQHSQELTSHHAKYFHYNVLKSTNHLDEDLNAYRPPAPPNYGNQSSHLLINCSINSTKITEHLISNSGDLHLPVNSMFEDTTNEALTTVSYASQSHMSTGFQTNSESIHQEPAKSTIVVPYLWERKIDEGKIVYLSPDGTKLDGLEAVKGYLLSEETCKCGLECPFHIDRVFSFDVTTSSLPWQPSDLSQLRNLTSQPCCQSKHIKSHNLTKTCLLIPKTTPPKRRASSKPPSKPKPTREKPSGKKGGGSSRSNKSGVDKPKSTPVKQERALPSMSQLAAGNDESMLPLPPVSTLSLPPVSSLTSPPAAPPSAPSSAPASQALPTAPLGPPCTPLASPHSGMLSPEQALRLQESALMSPHHAGLISPGQGLISTGGNPLGLMRSPPHSQQQYNINDEIMMMRAAPPPFYPSGYFPPTYMSRLPGPPVLTPSPGYHPELGLPAQWAAPGPLQQMQHQLDFMPPPGAAQFAGMLWGGQRVPETSRSSDPAPSMSSVPPRKRKRHTSSASSAAGSDSQALTPVVTSPHQAAAVSVIKRTNSTEQNQGPQMQAFPATDSHPIKLEDAPLAPPSVPQKFSQTTPLPLTSKSSAKPTSHSQPTSTASQISALPPIHRVLMGPGDPKYGSPGFFHPSAPLMHPANPGVVRLPPMATYYSQLQDAQDLTNKTPTSSDSSKQTTNSGDTNKQTVEQLQSIPMVSYSSDIKPPVSDLYGQPSLLAPMSAQFPPPNGYPPAMFIRGVPPRPVHMLRGADGAMYYRYAALTPFERPSFHPMQMPMYSSHYQPPLLNGHRMPTPISPPKKRRKKKEESSSVAPERAFDNQSVGGSSNSSMKAEDLSMKPREPVDNSQQNAAACITVAASSSNSIS